MCFRDVFSIRMSKDVISTRTCDAEENAEATGASTTEASESCNQKTENFAELRVKLDKQKQDHVIAMRCKSKEIGIKDNEIASLKTEIEQLKVSRDAAQENNQELQTEVCNLNEKLNQDSTLRRDYDASLNQLAKLAAERDSLREDRERFSEEVRRLEEYVEEKEKQLGNKQTLIEHLQNTVLNLGYEVSKYKSILDTFST